MAAWTSGAGVGSRARVTVIGRDGAVLADSQHDASSMDNHATRPEVRRALAGATGTAVRHSATLDVDLCYLAVPADLQGRPGVVLRLAVPLRQIDASVAAVRWIILRASLVAAAVALIVAFFVSRAFSRRIRSIQAFAQELVNTEYSGMLPSQPDDELGSVARSLRSMAEQFRHMLAAQAEELARRKALLAAMVEGVLAVDRDLRVTFCNTSFASAVNAREPLAERIPLVKVVRDPELRELLQRVIATGEPARRRLTPVAAEGRVFDVQGAPVAAGAIAVLHDITELKRLERVRRDFVANISHELRTPLATILGYTETLLDGALEDPANNRKFLEIIHRNTLRLGDMASDLLALSELETEQQPQPAEKISVREVALAAIGEIENQAVARNVDLFAGAIEDLYVMGEPFRLKQALVNLLDNGVRFNRSGGEVRLDAVQVGNQIRIQVSDKGIGIPFHELSRIFERFYCVDKARSRDTGGTGLGLAIVKHVAEKMGGTVGVESTLGKGSVFTLQFPSAT